MKSKLLFLLTFPVLSLWGQPTVKVTVRVRTTADWTGNTYLLTNMDKTVTYLSGGPYSGVPTTETKEADVPLGTRLLLTLYDKDASGLGAGDIYVWVDGMEVASHTGFMANYYYFVIDALSEKQCGEGEVETFIKINKYQGERIFLKLAGKGGSPVYFYYEFKSFDQFFTRVKTPEAIPLEFTITDPEGYGMSSPGYYLLYNKCQTIATGGSDFDISKTISFNALSYEYQGNVFEKVYGEELHDYGKAIVKVCEGGYLVGGTTGPENVAPRKQMFLMRLNERGDTLWKKTYGNSGDEYLKCIVATSDKGYMLGGTNGTAGIIIKVNARGDSVWYRSYPAVKEIMKMIQTQDGNYVMTGNKNMGSHTDVYLAKIDISGNYVWQKSYGNPYDNYGYSVTEDPSTGNLYVCGGWRKSNTTPWNSDEYDGFILRTSKLGDSLGIKLLGGNKGEFLNSIILTSDNNLAAVGVTYSYNGGANFYLVKMKPTTLDTIWTKNYGVANDGDYGEVGTDLVETSDKGYVLLGYAGNQYNSAMDILLLRVYSNGTYGWQKAYGRTYNDRGNALLRIADGSLVLVGDTYPGGYGQSRSDVYVAKVDTAGCLVEKPVITGDTLFCSGDSLLLVTSPMRTLRTPLYQWSTGTQGLSVYVKNKGQITVSVIDQGGCVKTSAVHKVDTLPRLLISMNYPDTAICANTSIVLSPLIKNKNMSHFYSYVWNTGATTSAITVKEEGTFFVKVTDQQTGCSATTQPVSVSIRYPYDKQKICMVTVSPVAGKNLIVWEKTPDQDIKSYHVYKVFGKSYFWIGEVPYDSVSVFTDLGSFPESYVSRYAISVEDHCKNESPVSPYHQTMLLQASKGTVLNQANLSWAKYEDEEGTFVPEYYYIYKGDSPSSMQMLDSVSGLLEPRYIDQKFNGIAAYYQIAVKKPVPCDPAGLLKAETGPYTQSLSNIVEYKISSAEDVSSSLHAVLSPNPVHEQCQLIFSLEKTSDVVIEIVNLIGVVEMNARYDGLSAGVHVLPLDVASLASGMYIVRVTAGMDVQELRCVRQ